MKYPHTTFAAIMMALTVFFLLTPCSPSMAQNSYSIVALVNDEPISNHDVNMRIKLFIANSTGAKKSLQKKMKQKRTQKLWREMVQKYRPQSRAEAQKLQFRLVKRLRREVNAALKKKIRKKILRELVDERLQMQQATKLGVALSEADLDERLDKIASRNKNKKTGKPMSRQQFSKLLKSMGIPVSEFRKRMQVQGSWVRVVRRKFRYQVNIGDQDVDRLLNDQGGKNSKLQTVFKIKRVRLAVSASASQSKKTAYLVKAAALRSSVTSCKQLPEAVNNISGASLKSLGSKTAQAFPYTLRSFLNNTRDGHLTPPTITSSGIELYAVCSRKRRQVADVSKREAVKAKLRREEFKILARRYLQDLRQEGSIEYR